MKKLILLITMVLAMASVKATNFTLVIATTDTAYAHYLTAAAVVTADLATLAGLGSQPTPPLYDSTGGQWDTYVSSLNTYNTSYVNTQDSIAVHGAAARTAELAVLASLGYGTVYTNICSDQWIKVQGSSFTTAWIGFSSKSTYLVKTTTKPTAVFPNIN